MTTTNREHLLNQLKETIDAATGPIAIQAGHFAAVHDVVTHDVVPGIYQEIADAAQRDAVQANPYMGNFPINTWELGAELVAYARAQGKQAGLVVLCNDWQWVQEIDSDVASGDNNPYRAKFYARAQLPATYLEILKKNNLDTSAILPFKNATGDIVHPTFFGETKLRKRYAKQFLGVCELGNACAQEYVPLLAQLQRDGIETMISCVPKTCLMPAKAGSRAAKQNFGVDMKIVNVFPGAISPETFWTEVITDVV